MDRRRCRWHRRKGGPAQWQPFSLRARRRRRCVVLPLPRSWPGRAGIQRWRTAWRRMRRGRSWRRCGGRWRRAAPQGVCLTPLDNGYLPSSAPLGLRRQARERRRSQTSWSGARCATSAWARTWTPRSRPASMPPSASPAPSSCRLTRRTARCRCARCAVWRLLAYSASTSDGGLDRCVTADHFLWFWSTMPHCGPGTRWSHMAHQEHQFHEDPGMGMTHQQCMLHIRPATKYTADACGDGRGASTGRGAVACRPLKRVT
mmetsp:Transcript_25599/g.65895  ORF Transcript_25599/g.65895 Transcript_25599/m.65895 type:complete len:260 (+) Transcript_25599:982-1761(+)